MLERGRAPVHHHRHSILDQQVTGEQHALLREPDHQVAGGVAGPWMGDHDRPRAEPQGVAAGHRPVGHVGELEPLHGVEPHHPDPVRDQRVRPGLAGQRAPVRMSDHLGAGAPEHDRAEVVIGVVVGQHQPPDRLPRNAAGWCAAALHPAAGSPARRSRRRRRW